MSKRVANKKGQSRKTPARSKVKFGWRKQQLIAMFGYEKVMSGEYLKELRS